MSYDNELLFVVHVVYLPHLASTGELKTKPAQRSVMELRKLGLIPDMLCVRSQYTLTDTIRDKLGKFCHIDKTHIIECPDINNIYEIPINYLNINIIQTFINKLHLNIINKNNEQIDSWRHYINYFKINHNNDPINIGIVGKYTHLKDSYLSLNYAIKHAAAHLNLPININWIESTNDLNIYNTLSNMDAIIIPGGFGERGIKTMITTTKYARLHNIPCLGICLGMHIMVIEAARNIIGKEYATSEEFGHKEGCFNFNINDLDIEKECECFNHRTPFVVVKTKESSQTSTMGGTMRKGLLTTNINPNSTNCIKAYQQSTIQERHRHRYEIAPNIWNKLKNVGFTLSFDIHGKNMDILELKNHPFYIGCQFHPEFLTQHNKPHPLFTTLLSSVKKLNT